MLDVLTAVDIVDNVQGEFCKTSNKSCHTADSVKEVDAARAALRISVRKHRSLNRVTLALGLGIARIAAGPERAALRRRPNS